MSFPSMAQRTEETPGAGEGNPSGKRESNPALGPISQVQVEEAITGLADDLERETEALLSFATRAARCEVEHKTARAKAYLRAEGTEKAREATADQAVEDELLTRRMAEARYEAQRELLRSLRARLDAMRSIGASVRGQL